MNLEQQGDHVPLILFTGAGASCAHGINLPNMTQFFQQIMDKDRMPTHNLILSRDYFKFVMDTIYPSAEETFDLEKVLGTLYKVSGAFSDDAAFAIFNHPTLITKITNAVSNGATHQVRNPQNNGTYGPNDIHSLIKQVIDSEYVDRKTNALSLLHELHMVIRETYSTVSTEGIYRIYGQLFSALFPLIWETRHAHSKLQTVFPIFTTNYDPSIDNVLKPDSTEETRRAHREWKSTLDIPFKSTDGFALDEFEASLTWQESAFNVEYSSGIVIPYHKLHGSVTWERSGKEIMKTTNVVADTFHSPRPFTMIYPSDKTTPEYNPYAFSHKELERYLYRANVLIVIGFAFRDPGIVSLFNRAMRDNSNLRTVVVGPKPRDWEPELSEFLSKENVVHVDAKFGTEEAQVALINNVEQSLNLNTKI